MIRKPIPSEVRAAVLHRAGYCCEDCGARTPLEMHHLTYYVGALDDIFGAETPDDLAALCRECHHDRHVSCWGEFFVDPDELAGREDQFEREMAK